MSLQSEPSPIAVEGVSKSFGGIKALSNVSLTLAQNEIVGMIGPNGSGKSTLLNCISGYYKLDRGKIRCFGADITGFSPHRIFELGLARTFQSVRIFQELTALQNVQIPLVALSKQSRDLLEERVSEAMELVGLSPSIENSEVRTLSLFQQRMLEIATRIVTKPKVLLLDEPAGGLSEGEIESLILIIKKLQERGVTILVIEHTLRVIVNVAARVVVLDQGQVIADASCDEVLSSQQVIDAYLGTG